MKSNEKLNDIDLEVVYEVEAEDREVGIMRESIDISQILHKGENIISLISESIIEKFQDDLMEFELCKDPKRF